MRPKRSTAACTAASADARLRDVELDDEQVVSLADGVGHGVSVAAGRDDRVAGGEGRPRDVYAHATAGAGDEPDLLVGHNVESSPCSLTRSSSSGSCPDGGGDDLGELHGLKTTTRSRPFVERPLT